MKTYVAKIMFCCDPDYGKTPVQWVKESIMENLIDGETLIECEVKEIFVDNSVV
jgi:hypothetical protein